MESQNNYRCLYNSYNYINDNNIKKHKTSDSNTYIYKSNKNSLNFNQYIDLSEYFPKVYSQDTLGITSSCAIISVISYYLKLYYNIDKLLSPYFLAYMQFMKTKNWNYIDLQTGINIASTIGICQDHIIDDNSLQEAISLGSNSIRFINDIDASYIVDSNELMFINENVHKIEYFSYIDLDVLNVIKLLNNKTPVLTSLKVIPIFSNNKSRSRSKSNHFYNYFNDEKYWTTTQEYYKNLNEISDIDSIYSVSIVIVGLDNTNKLFKIRGCWGDKVGDNGYFYISYDIMRKFSNLFFDSYIIDIKPLLTNNDSIELTDNLKFDLIDEFDDIQIIKLNNNNKNNIDNADDKKSSSFKKISSMGNIYDTYIKIESLDNLDFINDTINSINKINIDL